MLKRADNLDEKAKKLTLQAQQTREKYYQLKAKRDVSVAPLAFHPRARAVVLGFTNAPRVP